jgi:hypothetical protein
MNISEIDRANPEALEALLVPIVSEDKVIRGETFSLETTKNQSMVSLIARMVSRDDVTLTAEECETYILGLAEKQWKNHTLATAVETKRASIIAGANGDGVKPKDVNSSTYIAQNPEYNWDANTRHAYERDNCALFYGASKTKATKASAKVSQAKATGVQIANLAVIETLVASGKTEDEIVDQFAVLFDAACGENFTAGAAQLAIANKAEAETEAGE